MQQYNLPCNVFWVYMSDKNKFAVFLWRDGAKATWVFFDSVHDAVRFADAMVNEHDHYTDARVFEQRQVETFQNREKLHRGDAAPADQ